MMQLTRKCQWLAAMAALAMGPACADMDESRDGAELEQEDGDRDERPGAPSSDLTTYDRAAAVPGFALGISLAGDDVVLDWSGTGYFGDVIVYRSSDPHALLDIALDEPLAPGVEGIALYGVTSWVDVGAASRSVATPHYYYRVGQVQEGELGTELQLSTMVMKTTTATGPGFNRMSLCMLGGPTTASQLQALLGPSVIGVHQRVPGGTEFFNFRSWTPGGGDDFALEYGAGVVAQLDGSADAYTSLVGVVPTNEALEVTSEPGYNWMTLPVLYDGPTSTGYWVDTVGFWGVGAWSNLAQGSTWDWNDPAYAPFEMEACQTYDVYLPSDACTDNADCPADEFCYFVEAAACGDVASGLCFPRPPGCEGVPESPVCGCDGQEYASQCEADLAGVGVRGPESAGGGGEIVFDFEGSSPILEASGGWTIYTAAPPSDNPEVPFPSQVLGTDGNRSQPYPGAESESSFATIGPVTLGDALSLRSWHVDEGSSYYDRKRIHFEAEDGQTWVLVDCNAGINPQAFCEFYSGSRPGDQWDQISLDTAILSGQTGTLRFEYQTVDGCCSFEQGWFIDDISLDGCGVQPSGGPPQPLPDPNTCPAQCVNMPMWQQLVADPEAGPIDACYTNDYGSGGNAEIQGEGGYVSAYWDDFGSGQCYSGGAENYYSYNISNTQAEACGDLIEAQIAALGPACNGQVAVCGNGLVEAGEQCDGGDLGGNTCGSLGFVGGNLGCTADCGYDTSACLEIDDGTAVCDGNQDPVALALAACQAEYPNCSVMDGGVVGYGDGASVGSNCGTPDHPWRFYCTETSDASNYNCSACTVGEILGAHDPCNCNPDTSPVLGTFCTPEPGPAA